jgi:succinate dehydrogenase / fumarate reductase membrane anchor subunit
MRESTLWILHIISGAIILILLAIHMGIMHLDFILSSIGLTKGDPIDANIVFARSKQIFFMVTYIILLGTALYHGFYGFRTILFELVSNKLHRMITWLFSLVGVALFVYGTYAAIFVFMIKETSS